MIQSPPTPFSCCFAPLFGGVFGVCVPGRCFGQELGSSDFLPWGHWAPAGPGSCTKPVLGDTPMQEASTEKGSSKYSQKGKVICPSRRLEQNLEQGFFACQCNPLTFNNNAATLSWRPLFISSMYKWLSMKDFLPRGSKWRQIKAHKSSSKDHGLWGRRRRRKKNLSVSNWRWCLLFNFLPVSKLCATFLPKEESENQHTA